MMADEFYQKNAALSNDGYRLTDIEAYEIGRGKFATPEVGQPESNVSKQRRRKRIVNETFLNVPVDLG